MYYLRGTCNLKNELCTLYSAVTFFLVWSNGGNSNKRAAPMQAKPAIRTNNCYY